MSRVIHTDGMGKERSRLIRSILLALRELIQQDSTGIATRDLAAYIALALEAISRSIDPSVEAWEKRGYWVKADRFRMEWQWTEKLGKELRIAVIGEDWPAVASISGQIAERMGKMKPPKRNNLGTPWRGAWVKLVHPD